MTSEKAVKGVGILERMGFKLRGRYCYYVPESGTAVVVGIRGNKGIPKKIGRHTVRGIHKPSSVPGFSDRMAGLTDKQRRTVASKLARYRTLETEPLDKLPATVEFLGYYSAAGTAYLTLPDHIRYIDELKVDSQTVTLPEGLLYLGSLTERNTGKLWKVAFGIRTVSAPPHLPVSRYLGREVEEVAQIASGALVLCNHLRQVWLGAGLEKIGENALPSDCGNLINIGGLPFSLRQVGEDVFNHCSMDTVRYPEDIPEALRNQRLRFGQIERLTVTQLDGLESYLDLLAKGEQPQRHSGACLYQLLRGAKKVEFKIPFSRIPDGMFMDCTKMTSLSFAEPYAPKITFIGADAFRNCTMLQSVLLGRFQQHIGDRAFMGSGIKSLTTGGLLKTIGVGAFRQCKALTRLTLGKNVSSIGKDAFAQCENLELTAETAERIKEFDGFASYQKVQRDRLPLIQKYLSTGDMYRKNGSKELAYAQYDAALQLDHYRKETMDRLVALLTDAADPADIAQYKLQVMQGILKDFDSPLLAQLDAALKERERKAVALCKSGKPHDARKAYILSRTPESAVILCELIMQLWNKYPVKVMDTKKGLVNIAEQLAYHTKGHKQQERVSAVWSWLTDARASIGILYPKPITLVNNTEYISNQHIRYLYDQASAFVDDAKLWGELLHKLAPELPVLKPTKMVVECSTQSYSPLDWQVTPVPDERSSVRYIGSETEEEFNRRTSEILSEIRMAEEASRIVREIEEDMFSPPGTYGGY